MKHINISISDDMWRAIKSEALQGCTTMTDVIRKALTPTPTIRLSPAMWEEAKIAAIRNNVSLAELIDRALREFLAPQTYTKEPSWQSAPGRVVDSWYEDELGNRVPPPTIDLNAVSIGQSVISTPEAIAERDRTTASMRANVDAKLPKVLPRK